MCLIYLLTLFSCVVTELHRTKPPGYISKDLHYNSRTLVTQVIHRDPTTQKSLLAQILSLINPPIQSLTYKNYQSQTLFDPTIHLLRPRIPSIIQLSAYLFTLSEPSRYYSRKQIHLGNRYIVSTHNLCRTFLALDKILFFCICYVQ